MLIIIKILRYLTLPLALLYGLIIAFRNYLYDRKIVRSIKLSVPSIAVGNLIVGGSGKTPHIEYLIQFLHNKFKVATLSRGYKRHTKGFVLAEENDNARTIGDEPMQFKTKFPDIEVSVCEERLLAIPNLIGRRPYTQVILLDDAFQHRTIQPGINILLTEYNRPYWKDYIVPFGNLREARSGANRADIIIVSKCPEEITQKDKEEIIQQIKPLSQQQVYFTTIRYSTPYRYTDKLQTSLTAKDLILVAGIAQPKYLYYYLQNKSKSVHLLKYNDHYYYSERDVNDIIEAYHNLKSENKIIITTEKDATRLSLHKQLWEQHNIPLYVLPIEVVFLFNEADKFNEQILEYIKSCNYMLDEPQQEQDIEISYTIVE